MKRKQSTLDKIANLTGLRDANNDSQPEKGHVKETFYFDTGGFAQSRMDSDVFDRNPDPWPQRKKKHSRTAKQFEARTKNQRIENIL